MAQGPGQHRLGQVEAPAAVGGEGRVEGLQQAVLVEGRPPLGVEPVPLAGHGEVLGAGEPHPNRAAGEPGPQRGDGRVPVRLHLLAAEPTPHPQALHGDLVGGHAEHVGHDVLRLGRVLGAALHEHLARLVDLGERAVRLEVEVLLAGEVELAAEDAWRRGERRLDVAALHQRPAALEAVGGDRLAHRHDGGQRLVVDLDRQGPEPGGLEGLGEHPAHGLPVEHHLGREQRLVAPAARVVVPRHVVGREHTHHPGHGEGGCRAQAGHPGVGVGCLHRMGVQHAPGAPDEVVGVERLPGDVQGRGLVGHRLPHDGPGRSLAEPAHRPTSSGSAVCECSRARAVPSIAER